MTEKDEIAALFRSRLSEHQESVDPSIWNNIQHGLQTQSIGASAGAVAKTSGLFKTLAVAGLVIGGGIVTTVVYLNVVQEDQVEQNEVAVTPVGNTPNKIELEKDALLDNPVENSNATEIQTEPKPFDPQQSLKNVGIESAGESTTNQASAPDNQTEPKQIKNETSIKTTQETAEARKGSTDTGVGFTKTEDSNLPNNLSKTENTEYQFLTKEIPNIFTPNGDGFNDLFSIPLGVDMRHQTKIFDKRGVLVAEFDDRTEGWNGLASSGAELSEGTYFYVTFVSYGAKSSKQFKGTISLKR